MEKGKHRGLGCLDVSKAERSSSLKFPPSKKRVKPN